MRSSDAKYKIYLDEHAVITDRNFLVELPDIFRDKQIGAVDTGGAVELSTNGVAPASAKRTPKNFRGEVQVADGFFFATQYDLPWRHDLFEDNFFGGQAQCVKFRRAGYKVFVVGDWVSNDISNLKLDETARQKFLDEYSADLFPLVTSARNFIDANGRVITNAQDVFGKNVKLPGNEAGKLLFTFKNYIGEPTTVLIRKKFLRDNDLCWNASERGFFSLVDMSTWLHLLTQGSMIRLIECLSALRTHNQQMTYSKGIYKCAPYDYAKLLKQAWDGKYFMTEPIDFKIGASCLLLESGRRLRDLYKAGVYDDGVALLEKTANALAQSLVNGCNLELPTA